MKVPTTVGPIVQLDLVSDNTPATLTFRVGKGAREWVEAINKVMFGARQAQFQAGRDNACVLLSPTCHLL